MVGKDLVKLRGLSHGVTGVFYRTLKKKNVKNKVNYLVVPIDEFKSSRICSICKTDTLQKAFHTCCFGVLVCKTCKKLWQRGVNASKNMMSIVSSIWSQDGRPTAFKKIYIYLIYISYCLNVHGLDFYHRKDFRLLQVNSFRLTL